MPNTKTPSWRYFANRANLDLSRKSTLRTRPRFAPTHLPVSERLEPRGQAEKYRRPPEHTPPWKESIRQFRSATAFSKAETEPSAGEAEAARPCQAGASLAFSNRKPGAQC